MDIKKNLTIVIITLFIWGNALASGKVPESITVTLNDLGAGKFKRVKWGDLEILVVRRSASQLKNLDSEVSQLADPISEERIPLESIICKECVSKESFVRTNHRSINPEFFAAINMGPYSGCHIIPFLKEGEHYWSNGNKVGLGNRWKGGFYDSCRNLKYDLSGRIYKNEKSQENLFIPAYQVNQENELVLGK